MARSQASGGETPLPNHLESTSVPVSQLTVEQIIVLQAKNAELEQQLEQMSQALAASEACRQSSEAKLNGILNSAIASLKSFTAFLTMIPENIVVRVWD